MADLYGPSTSSEEPSLKKIKLEDLEDDFSGDEVYLFSGKHGPRIGIESDEESEESEVELEDANEQMGASNTPTIPEEEKWHNDCPALPKIPFLGPSGFHNSMDNATAIECFNMYFTETFLQFLVNRTNAYAASVVSSTESNRISEWRETSISEIRVFLGLLFLTGIIRINRIAEYWKKHPLFNLSFPKFIGRDRFLILLRCLHFDEDRHSSDILQKIRPLLNHFNKTTKELYAPSKELLIDVSMVSSHGRVKLKQYLPNKRYKYGVKLHFLAEPNGMIQKLHLCAGTSDTEVSSSNNATKIVTTLLEGTEGKGHAVYMDSNYTSIALVEHLLSKITYCTGILQPSRKGNPISVANAHLRRGETRYKYTKDGICCCKWRDKRDILCISSEYKSNMVEYKNKHGQIVLKPDMIIQYNKFMKGINRQDHMLNYYPIEHRSLRWYKKLGIHIMHVMLNNAYILYSKMNRRTNFYDFQLDVIMNLLPLCSQQIPVNKKCHIHLPELFPKGKTGKTLRKRCRHCMLITGRRVDTIYCCPSCEDTPGLCLTPCFRQFHKYR